MQCSWIDWLLSSPLLSVRDVSLLSLRLLHTTHSWGNPGARHVSTDITTSLVVILWVFQLRPAVLALRTRAQHHATRATQSIPVQCSAVQCSAEGVTSSSTATALYTSTH